MGKDPIIFMNPPVKLHQVTFVTGATFQASLTQDTISTANNFILNITNVNTCMYNFTSYSQLASLSILRPKETWTLNATAQI